MKEREPHLIIIDDCSEAIDPNWEVIVQEWAGSRAEQAWKAWGFTDEPPKDVGTYRLWKLLRGKLKEKGEES